MDHPNRKHSERINSVPGNPLLCPECRSSNTGLFDSEVRRDFHIIQDHRLKIADIPGREHFLYDENCENCDGPLGKRSHILLAERYCQEPGSFSTGDQRKYEEWKEEELGIEGAPTEMPTINGQKTITPAFPTKSKEEKAEPTQIPATEQNPTIPYHQTSVGRLQLESVAYTKIYGQKMTTPAFIEQFEEIAKAEKTLGIISPGDPRVLGAIGSSRPVHVKPTPDENHDPLKTSVGGKGRA